jgi:hypothetical protein
LRTRIATLAPVDAFLLVVAALGAAYALFSGLGGPPVDFAAIWRGYDRLLSGASPYAAEIVPPPAATPYVHPPGSPLLLGWLGALPQRTAALLYVGAVALALPVAVLWWMRTAGAPLRLAAAALLAATISLPYGKAIELGNIDALCLLLLAVGLSALAHRRRHVATVLLAAAVVAKPTAGLVVLAPILAGEVAVGIVALVGALGVNALGLLVVPEADRFLTEVLPYLRDEQPYVDVNGALAGVPSTLGAPRGTLATPIVAFAVVATVLAVYRYRRELRGDLAACVAVAVIAGLLVPTYSFDWYQIYLALAVPYLLRLRTSPSLAVAAVAGFAVYCVVSKDVWRTDASAALDHVLELRTMVGNLAVAVLTLLLLEQARRRTQRLGIPRRTPRH